MKVQFCLVASPIIWTIGTTWMRHSRAESSPCVNWMEKHPANPPSARGHAAMAYHPANGLVLFGGDDSPGVSAKAGDTWAYHNDIWTQLLPSTSPPSREQHAMVYAPACGGVLLFGGSSSSSGDLNDMWRWNGSTWSQIPQAGSWPSARRAHAMAYDRARGVVVLYGGVGVAGTWEYKCGTGLWDQTEAVSAPGSKEGHFMEWHPSNGVLLFGAASISNDTWAWNGVSWTLLSPTSCAMPQARAWSPLAYDEPRNRIVMFGGNPDQVGTGMNDTWEWDGACWSQIYPNNPGGQPPVRSRHVAAFDPTIGKTVVFGDCSNITE